MIAAAVLGDLWRRRHERKPVLIVIDEAHNVCPADPPDQLTAQAAGHAIRIAAEGRKFGLSCSCPPSARRKSPRTCSRRPTTSCSCG